MGDLEVLQDLAAELGSAVDARPQLAARAERLTRRLAEGCFHVVVLGEFNRGKSTLINALLGAEVLPMGVVPITAVITEVAYGKSGATVITTDGRSSDIELDELVGYATEAGNPANRRGVDRIQVRRPCRLLSTGLVLVDTPGIGSVHGHNTEVGRDALLEADGAVLVLSADEPLSEGERERLGFLVDREARTFLVVNKADHLDGHERDQVAAYLRAETRAALGRGREVHFVAARAALSALARGVPPGCDAVGWPEFSDAFELFAHTELESARVQAARAELSRIAAELRDAVLIEASAAELDVASFAAQVEELHLLAVSARRAFEEDGLLLAHEVDVLMGTAAEALRAFAASEPARAREDLVRAASGSSLGQLEEDLRSAVGNSVRERFESFRLAEAERTEVAWEELATRFRVRTEALVNAMRDTAGDLLAIELPAITIPPVDDERERFSYLFVHVGSTTEGFGRLARRFLPARVVRHRMIERAQRQLVAEFDKHAGRARWDLEQRLDAVRRRFEGAMGAELDRGIEGLLAAANRADEWRSASVDERRRREGDDATALDVVERVLALCADAHDRAPEGDHRS